MVFRATLTAAEVKKFCTDFYETDEARVTGVGITPAQFNFNVVLTPEKANADLLEASLHNGLLSHFGWRNKFAKN